MRQILNTKNGGVDTLQIREAPDPVAEDDELRIEVKASGLNFADILARRGLYPDAPPKPCVVGYEVAGVVDGVGKNLDPQWKGKEVVALTRFKGQAEKVTVKQAQVFEKPERLSFAEAAAVPVNYLTSWMLIVVMGSLQPYESILIHNAGGGVGLAALDIARYIGATTYGTASARKHDMLKERGLDYTIDYRDKDWYTEIMNLTGGKGVELIIDPLGGSEWKRGYKALRSTGRLGMFGISSASENKGIFGQLGMIKLLAQMPIFHPLSLLSNNKGVFGVNLGHLWHESEKVGYWTNDLLKGLNEGWLNPRVDQTFSFDQVADAHTYIEERKNFGKVILVP